jgi:hypothetical protein
MQSILQIIDFLSLRCHLSTQFRILVQKHLFTTNRWLRLGHGASKVLYGNCEWDWSCQWLVSSDEDLVLPGWMIAFINQGNSPPGRSGMEPFLICMHG